MKRHLTILLIIGLVQVSFSQSTEPSKKGIALYPLNIPYIFFGRYQTSMEFGVNYLDYMVVGAHFNRHLNYQDGNGWGLEFQYRVNRNRDANVAFRTISYWGPYFEYDRIKYTYSYYYPQPTDAYAGIVNIGLLTGNKISIGAHGLLDLFYGFGLAFVREKYNDNSYSSTYPYFKAGLQFGIKFR